MSCCCDQQPMMGALMGALGLAPDVKFRLGFWSDAGLWVDASEEERLLSILTKCLRDTGRFRTINITAMGGTFNPYYVVAGQTNVGFAQEDDLVNLIANTIRYHCGIKWDVEATDQLIIDSVPQTHASDPNVRQPAPAPGDTVRTRTDGHGSSKSLFDEIADELKMKKSEAQLLVIGGGALLLVLLMKR